MANINVHEFMTLNGVVDAPVRGPSNTASIRRWARTWRWSPAKSKAILLGRNTYQMFEPAWSTRTAEDDPGAPFFNDTTKYVVSSTLTEGTWRNSEILGPYDPDAIRALKERTEGDIYISGSITLVRALLADGLIDHLHLFVYPLTLGHGPALFAEVRLRPSSSWSRAAPMTTGSSICNYLSK